MIINKDKTRKLSIISAVNRFGLLLESEMSGKRKERKKIIKKKRDTFVGLKLVAAAMALKNLQQDRLVQA